MGKQRKSRFSKKKACLEAQSVDIHDDKKITLTPKQLQDLVVRIRINQMQKDGFNRKQIMSMLGCSKNTYTRWQGVGFGDVLQYVEQPRTGRPKLQ